MHTLHHAHTYWYKSNDICWDIQVLSVHCIALHIVLWCWVQNNSLYVGVSKHCIHKLLHNISFYSFFLRFILILFSSFIFFGANKWRTYGFQLLLSELYALNGVCSTMFFDWLKMRSMPNISGNMAKVDEDGHTQPTNKRTKTVRRHTCNGCVTTMIHTNWIESPHRKIEIDEHARQCVYRTIFCKTRHYRFFLVPIDLHTYQVLCFNSIMAENRESCFAFFCLFLLSFFFVRR